MLLKVVYSSVFHTVSADQALPAFAIGAGMPVAAVMKYEDPDIASVASYSASSYVQVLFSVFFCVAFSSACMVV